MRSGHVRGGGSPAGVGGFQDDPAAAAADLLDVGLHVAGDLQTEDAGLAAWWSPEAVERGISEGITLVALDGERVVGMAGLGREADFWVLWKLSVLPEYQGRGVGQALLDGAIAVLPDGSTQLLLDVLVTNEAAITFYRKHGFGAQARTPDRDLGAEVMWMSRDL
ncbi:hypothetical protein GCM10009789_79620 [Kribbella sancticallisti]|uniref:N-acetyltransferase domain-containing protein n=1 Tax=Kribbella sancticallisti TaxID=460087 RepID=A0ABP4QLY9_9ACTN